MTNHWILEYHTLRQSHMLFDPHVSIHLTGSYWEYQNSVRKKTRRWASYIYIYYILLCIYIYIILFDTIELYIYTYIYM
jgi:hypothetical protein